MTHSDSTKVGGGKPETRLRMFDFGEDARSLARPALDSKGSGQFFRALSQAAKSVALRAPGRSRFKPDPVVLDTQEQVSGFFLEFDFDSRRPGVFLNVVENLLEHEKKMRTKIRR